MDGHLKGREYLANELSIADIANWAWVRIYDWSGVSIDDFPHLSAWLDRLDQRPAFQKGIKTPPSEYEEKAKEEDFVKGARNMLLK